MSVTSIVRSPTLPTHNVDLTWALPTGGTTYTCGDTGEGDDYDAADLATVWALLTPGDVLVLRAGTTFNISSTLSLLALANAGNDWIYVISSAYANLGTIYQRAGPDDTANMPKINWQGATSSRVIDTEWNAGGTKANYWRLMGLEITADHNTTASTQTGLVGIGRYGADKVSDADDQPHHIIIDRCYIHGQSAGNYGWGIEGSCKEYAIISSTIDEIHIDGAESQGISIAMGEGDIQIYNNYIEAAGINCLIGGSTQQISNAQIENVHIWGNHFSKPVAWKTADWTVKNVMETKGGVGVLIEGNIFENSWYDGQDGTIVSLKNAAGSLHPWTTCSDVTIRWNWIRNGLIGFKFKIKDNSNESYYGLADFLIHDNVMDNINSEFGNNSVTASRLFEIDPTDYGDLTGNRIVIRHNTCLHDGQNQNDRNGSYMLYLSSCNKEVKFLVFENNVMEFWGEATTLANRFGIKSDGTSIGLPSITKACGDQYRFTNNIYVHTRSGSWPPGDAFVADLASMNFSDYSVTATDVRGYALTAFSPGYQGSTSGRDCGANVGAIYDATLHCEDGDW